MPINVPSSANERQVLVMITQTPDAGMYMFTSSGSVALSNTSTASPRIVARCSVSRRADSAESPFRSAISSRSAMRARPAMSSVDRERLGTAESSPDRWDDFRHE